MDALQIWRSLLALERLPADMLDIKGSSGLLGYAAAKTVIAEIREQVQESEHDVHVALDALQREFWELGHVSVGPCRLGDNPFTEVQAAFSVLRDALQATIPEVPEVQYRIH